MNRDRGLLAFACTLLAAVAVFVQVPVASGLAGLANSLFGSDSTKRPPLAAHLRTAAVPELPRGPGHTTPLSLQEMHRDTRPDDEIARLSQRQRIPPALLEALAVISARSVQDTAGHYWCELPSDAPTPTAGEQTGADGLARTRAAAALLSRLRNQTGSQRGALLAWTTGILWARRAIEAAGGDPGRLLEAIRTHLPSRRREMARTFLCTVEGLAATLDACWPVGQPGARPAGAGVRLEVGAGAVVRAPMDGRVRWVGLDGPRGKCVELQHACDLHSVLCSLARIGVQPGQRVRRGQPLGKTEADGGWFALRLGNFRLDPAVLVSAD